MKLNSFSIIRNIRGGVEFGSIDALHETGRKEPGRSEFAFTKFSAVFESLLVEKSGFVVKDEVDVVIVGEIGGDTADKDEIESALFDFGLRFFDTGRGDVDETLILFEVHK